MSKVRHPKSRDDADRRLPVFVRLHELRRASKAEVRRLLCVLLPWFRPVPASPGGRDTHMPSAMTVEIRPGIHRPDWSIVTTAAAREALLCCD